MNCRCVLNNLAQISLVELKLLYLSIKLKNKEIDFDLPDLLVILKKVYSNLIFKKKFISFHLHVCVLFAL